jgi:hypothetical protein
MDKVWVEQLLDERGTEDVARSSYDLDECWTTDKLLVTTGE